MAAIALDFQVPGVKGRGQFFARRGIDHVVRGNADHQHIVTLVTGLTGFFMLEYMKA